jgi:hypothetical protein
LWFEARHDEAPEVFDPVREPGVWIFSSGFYGDDGGAVALKPPSPLGLVAFCNCPALFLGGEHDGTCNSVRTRASRTGERHLILAGIITATASFFFATVLHAVFGLDLVLTTFGLFVSATAGFLCVRWRRQ